MTEPVLRLLPGGGSPPPPHHPFPLREYTLKLFLALRGVRLSAATLKFYLAGLQPWIPQQDLGHALSYVLRGLWRSQGARFTRPPRWPITVTTVTVAGGSRRGTPSCSVLPSCPPSLASCARPSIVLPPRPDLDDC